MTTLSYKGYIGSCDVSIEDQVIFGKLMHIRDLVTYEADTIGDIQAAFEAAVEDYLDDCREEGREPDKPFKGSFNIRVSANLHRDLYFAAKAAQLTFNSYISHVLSEHKACTAVHGVPRTRAWASHMLLPRNQVVHLSSSSVRELHMASRSKEVEKKFSVVQGPRPRVN